jgi:hypothetical protein
MDLLLHIGALACFSPFIALTSLRSLLTWPCVVTSGDIAYAVGYGAQWDEYVSPEPHRHSSST